MLIDKESWWNDINIKKDSIIYEYDDVVCTQRGRLVCFSSRTHRHVLYTERALAYHRNIVAAIPSGRYGAPKYAS